MSAARGMQRDAKNMMVLTIETGRRAMNAARAPNTAALTYVDLATEGFGAGSFSMVKTTPRDVGTLKS
jgi:hypothetical protein